MKISAITASLRPVAISFFPYDSDKSSSGKSFAYEAVLNYLAPDSVRILDEMQRTRLFEKSVDAISHFWHVLEFKGKYLNRIRQEPPENT